MPPKISFAKTVPKAVPENDHPERDRRRQRERDQHARDEEALVDLVLADHRHERLDDAAGRHRGAHDRQVLPCADEHVQDRVLEVVAEAEGVEEPGLPGVERRGALGDREQGLVAGVVHRHADARDEGEHDRDHQALVVEAVADVRGGSRHFTRGEEAGELGLPERIEELELATLLEVVLDVEVRVLEELHGSPQPSFSMISRFCRRSGP